MINPVIVDTSPHKQPKDDSHTNEEKVILDHQCKQCDKAFESISFLIKHIKTAHKSINSYFFCTYCSFVSKKKHNLIRHLENEHEGKSFKCANCNYESKYSKALKDHVEGVHEGNAYMCDQCDYTSVHRAAFANHMKVVHLNVRYPCTVCEYKATRKGNLQAHMRTVHMLEKRLSKERRVTDCQ